MVITAIISIILILGRNVCTIRQMGTRSPKRNKPYGAFGGTFNDNQQHLFKGHRTCIEVLVLDVLSPAKNIQARKLEWLMHILIFWAGSDYWYWRSLQQLLSSMGFYSWSWPRNLYRDVEILELPNDIFGWMLVAGIVIAIARRLFSREKMFRQECRHRLDLDNRFAYCSGDRFYAQYLRADVYKVSRDVISVISNGILLITSRLCPWGLHIAILCCLPSIQ